MYTNQLQEDISRGWILRIKSELEDNNELREQYKKTNKTADKAYRTGFFSWIWS